MGTFKNQINIHKTGLPSSESSPVIAFCINIFYSINPKPRIWLISSGDIDAAAALFVVISEASVADAVVAEVFSVVPAVVSLPFEAVVVSPELRVVEAPVVFVVEVAAVSVV